MIYLSDNYIKNKLNDCKAKIVLEKSIIMNLINFYNKYKNIDVQTMTDREKNKFFDEFKESRYVDDGKAYHKLDNYLVEKFSLNLSKFDVEKLGTILTGKNLVKKTITLNKLFIYDIYDRYDYDYSRLYIINIDILCEKEFDANKKYSIKEISNLTEQKEIIIMDSNSIYGELFNNRVGDRYINGDKLKTDIRIGDVLFKKGTTVYSDNDSYEIYKKLEKFYFPNIYNFQYSFKLQLEIIDNYEEIYGDYKNIIVQEMIKMIPNEIKLRRQKIDELITETKNSIIDFVEECKSYFKEVIKKQEKLKDKALKDKVLNEELNNEENNLNF